jgi:hypothetical protein
MHDDNRSGQLAGTPDELARLGRCTVSELLDAFHDLTLSKAARVTRYKGQITVINRRMVRESHTRENARLRKQDERVRKKSRECHNASSISSSEMCEFSKNENSHTPRRSAARSAPLGAVCVKGSKFSLEECRKYAESLTEIRNPSGFAKKIQQTGSDDQAIAEFLAHGSETPEERYARIGKAAADQIARSAKSDN